MDLTVVIPTYNRRALLADAVASLRRQTHPADRYELLIISDGSTDGSDDDYATPLTGPATRLVRQEKRGFGLSRARNLGARLAAGRLVMFFDDDMVAEPGLVAAHVAAHARFGAEVAVIGQVRLSPKVPATPFCRIVLGDVCGRYEGRPDEARFLEFGNALSWQTSFKREALLNLGGYDDGYSAYGWEDIEFSYRATRSGWRFYYEPAAVSLHNDQRQTLSAHGARLRTASRMAPLLFAQYPGLAAQIPMYADKGPIVWGQDRLGLVARKLARQLLATRPVMAGLEALTPWVERLAPEPALRRWYYGLLGSYVLRGYREGLAAGPDPRVPAAQPVA